MTNFNRGHAVGCAALRHGVPCTCWEPVAMNRLQAENERLKEELEDGLGAYRSVMKEACDGGVTYETDDRLHCTCVPHLREGVKAITAENELLKLEILDMADDLVAMGRERDALRGTVAHLEDRLAQATQAALDFALGRPRPTQTPQQTCRDGGDNV